METALIGRQPILDQTGAIYAYELLFRDSKRNSAQIEDGKYASAKVASDILTTFGVEKVVDSKLAFINIDESLLFDEALLSIPPERFVFDLSGLLDPGERFARRLGELAEAGYTFALDERDVADFPADRLAAVLRHLAIVRVDVKSVKTGVQIRQKMARFGAAPLRFLAERVETLKQFEVCKALGFSYFQGYFFARPHILESKKIASGHATVIALINRLNDETTDMEEIKEAIMHDPGLTIGLLRYVNSPFFPTRHEISSITQALGLLGRHPLLNWLLLTLYSNAKENPFKDPILESVMLRSEFMATFAKRFRMEKAQCEKAYLVGMLSLLSPMLGAKPEDILQDIAFDEEIRAALLKKEGPLGNLLKLIVLIERGEYTKTLAILSRLKISEREFTQILSKTYAATESYLRS